MTPPLRWMLPEILKARGIEPAILYELLPSSQKLLGRSLCIDPEVQWIPLDCLNNLLSASESLGLQIKLEDILSSQTASTSAAVHRNISIAPIPSQHDTAAQACVKAVHSMNFISGRDSEGWRVRIIQSGVDLPELSTMPDETVTHLIQRIERYCQSLNKPGQISKHIYRGYSRSGHHAVLIGKNEGDHTTILEIMPPLKGFVDSDKKH